MRESIVGQMHCKTKDNRYVLHQRIKNSLHPKMTLCATVVLMYHIPLRGITKFLKSSLQLMRVQFPLAFFLFWKIDISFLMHFSLWLVCGALVLLAVIGERLFVCLFALVLSLGIVLHFSPWSEIADSREDFDWYSG